MKVSWKDAVLGKEVKSMEEKVFTVSEAAKKAGVDAHVLRYWEEELQLTIGRNKKGHRYYTEENLRQFAEIQDLKSKGLQLKEIRDMLHKTEAAGAGKEAAEKTDIQNEANTSKKPEKLSDEKRQEQFYAILERLVKEVAVSNHREGRYKRLDAAIRRQQEARKQIAVTEEKKKRRRAKAK